MLLADKRRSVRFHAAQSIAVFGALQFCSVILAKALILAIGIGNGVAYLLVSILMSLVNVGSVGLAIFLAYRANRGQLYHLPLAGEYADSLAGRATR